VGGRRAHTIALVVSDRRYRKTDLAEGEVAMYTHEGDYIHFRNGRVIEVVAGASISITAPSFSIDGDLTVTGSVSDGSGSMQAMRDVFNAHTHTGDSGGNTGTPSGSM